MNLGAEEQRKSLDEGSIVTTATSAEGGVVQEAARRALMRWMWDEEEVCAVDFTMSRQAPPSLPCVQTAVLGSGPQSVCPQWEPS